MDYELHQRNPVEALAGLIRIPAVYAETRAGLCQLLYSLGFRERIRVDHHIFVKDGVEEIVNLQPKGGKAKPYQVKQVRKILLRYKLGGDIHA